MRAIMIKLRKHKICSKLFLFMVLVLFVGLASCGGGNEGSENEWKYVGDVRDEKGEYIKVYIDLNNMVIDDNIRRFWIRYYAKKDSASEERYIRQMGLWEVNCNDGALYVLGEEYYATNGQLLGRNEERREEDYKEGSLGDKLASAACRYAGRN